MKMVRLMIVLLLSFIPYELKAQEPVNVDHFLMMPCINGESGFINNPSAYSLSYGNLSLALHNFTFKAVYGVHDIMEAGIYFNFGGNSDLVSILKGGAVNFKITPLNEKEHFVTVAAGLERFPFNVVEEFPGDHFKFYTVVSKNAWDMNFTIGGKKRITNDNFDLLRWDFMADVSKVVNDTVLVTLEYDGRDINASAKISLNYNISMEVILLSLNKIGDAGELGALIEKHFVFGINFLR